jgi:serine/threonine protein phosphatase PrpC
MISPEAATQPNESFALLEASQPLASRRASTRWAVSSRPGPRGPNQDAWRVIDDCLFLLADGMGGLEAGDLAARAALDALGMLPAAPEITDWRPALRAADRAVRQVAEQAGVSEAGTTLTALVAYEGHAVITHLGDSRIHRLRRNELTCLTRDHSVASDLDLDPSTIDRPAPWRLDALTAFLGAGPDRLRQEERAVTARPGDRFVLTTDGTHGRLSFDELARLGAEGTPDDAARNLVEAADAAGSVDDRTALVVDFGATRPIEPGEHP